jgi:phosphate starvation-inducible PhoH-like protein
VSRASPSRALQYAPDLTDNHRLANLCGPLDANLAQIGAALDVRITRRAERFTIEGEARAAQEAAAALARFHGLADRPLSVDDIQLGLVELRATDSTGAQRAPAAPGIDSHASRRPAGAHATPT